MLHNITAAVTLVRYPFSVYCPPDAQPSSNIDMHLNKSIIVALITGHFPD
jgi:hypothetical protein